MIHLQHSQLLIETVTEFVQGKQNVGRKEEHIRTKNCVHEPASWWKPLGYLPQLDRGRWGQQEKALAQSFQMVQWETIRPR